MDARSGSSAGRASAIVRARSQLRHAATMPQLVRPGCGPHLPAVSGVPLAGRLQMLGNQGGIFIACCWVT